MEFRLLGMLQVEAGGRDLTPGRPKQRALLALLLLREGQTVPKDDLLEALWGESPPATAATALQGHISDLRKRLGPERIETRSPGYRLRLLEGDELDLQRFSELIARSRDGSPTERVATLAEALALFRGEPLEDFRYEPFAAHEAARIEELRLSAVEEQLESQLELGRHEAAIPRLTALVGEYPYRERLRAALMLALYRAGRQTDALNAFQEARATLVDELGVEPGPPLRELERRILNQDPALAALDTLGAQAGEVPAGGVATYLCISDAEDPAVARSIVGQRGGSELASDERAHLFAFARARDAVAAALAVRRLDAEARCGLHSTASPGSEAGARGAATVCRAAGPGRILVSQSTRELLAETPLQDVDVRDLGRHRLQDLGPPWRLYQLVESDFADEATAPRSIETYRTNLPTLATTLVGREPEILELAGLITATGSKLVTLTGTAGVGKTRLALQAAARLLDDFDGGVYFVDLAPVFDPEAALQAAVATVGASDGEGGAEERLARHLRGRRALLVLDNLEHLLDLAPALEHVAETFGESRMLATSRVPLRLDLEREYRVEPLPIPQSLALFDARARSVASDFELSDANTAAVTAICRSLDGLPLAIELAASRIAVLSPVDLERRLDRRLRLLKRGRGGTVERHRTLRAAIDWSYELLGPDEQRLLAYLSIFVGGFTLEAVESVCGNELEAVDALAALVDASLVRQGGADREPRFALLETVREYAVERLEDVTDADDVRRRHAEHFLELAERAEPHLREAPGEWIGRLEPEQGNLRAALDRFEAAGENVELLRITGALWRFWYLTGQLAEGGRRIERALEVDDSVTPERAKALLGAAVMAGNLGDSLRLKQRAEEALSVSQAVGDVWTAAYAKHMYGNALRVLGEPRDAAQLFEESASEFRELGDEHSALLVTRNLARLREATGDIEGARKIHEENLRLARQTRNPRIEASSLGALAMIASDEGRELEALSLIRQSLIIHRGLGSLPDSALDLCRCACLLARGGSVETAARLLVFDSLHGGVGTSRLGMSGPNEEAWHAVRAKVGNERIEAFREEARSMSLDDALALAIRAL